MSDPAKQLKRRFLGDAQPPPADAALANLSRGPGRPARERGEPSVQFNLRLPASGKKKIRMLAARDSVSMSEVVMRAIELYEKAHGRLLHE
jgi:hypothetical protein